MLLFINSSWYQIPASLFSIVVGIACVMIVFSFCRSICLVRSELIWPNLTQSNKQTAYIEKKRVYSQSMGLDESNSNLTWHWNIYEHIPLIDNFPFWNFICAGFSSQPCLITGGPVQVSPGRGKGTAGGPWQGTKKGQMMTLPWIKTHGIQSNFMRFNGIRQDFCQTRWWFMVS